MIEILKYTKMVNDAFIEVNGSLKVSTSSQIGKRNLSDRKMDFLREYIRFVKESGASKVTEARRAKVLK